MQRQAALHQSLLATAAVFQGARDAVTGTTIAAPFPAAAKLLAAGYGCVEDLPELGMDPSDDAVAELERAGLTPDEVASVMSARGIPMPTDDA